MSPDSPPLVDWEHLNALARDWDAEMTAIFGEFLDSAARDLEALEAAADNPELARQLAHRLKGSSGNFGFAALHATAAELESRARGGLVDIELLRRAREQFEAARAEVGRRRGHPAPAP